MYGCSPDDEVKVKKPFPSKRVAPRSKEERGDNWEEMVDNALIHTKLSNSVLSTARFQNWRSMERRGTCTTVLLALWFWRSLQMSSAKPKSLRQVLSRMSWLEATLSMLLKEICRCLVQKKTSALTRRSRRRAWPARGWCWWRSACTSSKPSRRTSPTQRLSCPPLPSPPFHPLPFCLYLYLPAQPCQTLHPQPSLVYH